jgi:hypothetical protein
MIMSPTLAWFRSPQTHFLPNRGTVEAMLAGSAVELSDELAGRGEHDRVQSDGSVGLPSSEGILGDLGEITDVKTAMIEIEAECAGIAVPQGERGCCFGRVGEAVQLTQLHSTVMGLMSRSTPPAPIAASC